jgi:hypothetical protein
MGADAEVPHVFLGGNRLTLTYGAVESKPLGWTINPSHPWDKDYLTGHFQIALAIRTDDGLALATGGGLKECLAFPALK